MQGEVYVPYTPIGGSNMSRMANNDSAITGSSGGYDSDGDAVGTHVSWKYPGGITGAGHWGYLINRGDIYYDKDIESLLAQHNIEGENNIINFINETVAEYVARILNNDGEPGYDYTAFKDAFPGCSYSYV